MLPGRVAARLLFSGPTTARRNQQNPPTVKGLCRMKTFQCNKCGHQLQRPTQPYRCPACGSQAVGLFRLIQPGVSPARPGVPPSHGGTPPPVPGIPPAPPAPTLPGRPGSQPRPQSPRPAAPEKPQPASPQKIQRPAPTKAQPPTPSKPRPPAPAATPGGPTATEKPKTAEPPKPKAKPKPRPTRPPQFVWAYPEEPPGAESKPLTNAPAVASGGRIFLHVQGRLVALREREQRPEVCWEYVTGSHAPGPATVAPDGSIRLHCSDGLLHCVSSEGKQVWTPPGVGEPLGYAAPVVDEQGNTFLSAFDGGLIRVDIRGKQQRGRYFRSRQRFDAAGIIHGGVLYIGSEEGYVFAVLPIGGTYSCPTEWADEQKGRSVWDHAAEQGHAGWYVRCWPALTDDGTLVVAGRDERLHGFAPDGKPTWKTEMPGQMLGSPVIDPQGHVYVGLSQARRGQQPRGALVCVDGNSHKIRWQYQAAGPVESTPVIGDDRVIYFGDNTGLVHAVDFGGKPRWTAQLEAAVRSAGTIPAPQRVAFGLDNETLVVLKCSSNGLAQAGWPKIGKTLGQCGLS